MAEENKDVQEVYQRLCKRGQSLAARSLPVCRDPDHRRIHRLHDWYTAGSD